MLELSRAPSWRKTLATVFTQPANKEMTRSPTPRAALRSSAAEAKLGTPVPPTVAWVLPLVSTQHPPACEQLSHTFPHPDHLGLSQEQAQQTMGSNRGHCPNTWMRGQARVTH